MSKKYIYPPVWSFFVYLMLFIQTAQAGLFDSNPFSSNSGPVDVEEAFIMQPADEGQGKLSLIWQVRDDYYLYRDRVEFVMPDGVKLVARDNAPAVEKDDPLFGNVWVYKQIAQIELQLAGETREVKDAVISVTYQGCWEGGICYPPVTKKVPMSLIPSASALSGAQVLQASIDSGEATNALSGNTGRVTEQDRYAQLISSSNLWLALGLFFLAGLGLSMTPCVFPMIPILSSVIAGQGEKITTARSFTLSLVYVLAVAVTYTVAGVVAGLFGENLQAAFQNPWIISIFSALFVVLALSMFGFYQLQLPTSWQSRLSDASGADKGGSLFGVAGMGLLSALIVGPCMAAPLAGALIYIGQSGDPVFGGLALFSLSMGMGIPLLIVGVSAGKLLPKAGAWMDSVKAGFGVVLLAMAIWMLDRIVPTQVSMLLAALLFIITAVYMGALQAVADGRSNWLRFWRGVSLVLLIYGAALLVGVLSGSQSFLKPLLGISGGVAAQQVSLPFNKVTNEGQLDLLLAQAKQRQQPVMLDFYADWCVSCVELEEFTFKDVDVANALSGYILIKVDVTKNDQDAKALYKRFQIIGPPALVFYDRSGKKRDELMIVGTIKPQPFISHIVPLG